MKLHEIYPGQKRKLQTSDFDAVWNNLIVPNCNEIIETYRATNSLLFRGTPRFTSPIFRGSSRIDRRPRDSYALLSELFELGLKESGMTALRSNSIFVNNSTQGALNFGCFLYVIFPINGFEYTYTKFGDITLNSISEFEIWANTKTCRIINKLCNVNKSHNLYNPWDNFNWLKDSYLFNKSHNIDNNIQHINKLLTSFRFSPIDPIDLIDMEKFKDFFEPRNTGLNDILSKTRSREFMIKGSYYAIESQFFDKLKEKLF